jgi:uncharacterized SAM-binding protein YcdF (DUF218 family)
VAGFLLLVVGLILIVLDRTDTTVIYVILVLGAGLISPGFVVDLIRAWRSRNGASNVTNPPA